MRNASVLGSRCRRRDSKISGKPRPLVLVFFACSSLAAKLLDQHRLRRCALRFVAWKIRSANFHFPNRVTCKNQRRDKSLLKKAQRYEFSSPLGEKTRAFDSCFLFYCLAYLVFCAPEFGRAFKPGSARGSIFRFLRSRCGQKAD